MQLEIAENFTNATIKDESSYVPSAELYIFAVMLVIVCVIGICTDVMMVYMTFRFKKLRTVPNIIISNWAIADIYPLTLASFDYVIYSFVEYPSVLFDIMSFLYEVEYVFYNTILLFITSLIIDWCLATYFLNASEKYRKYYKFTVATIWVLSLITTCVTLSLRIHNLFFVLPIITFFFIYIAVLMFIIILQIARRIEKCKRRSSNYPTLTLTIATVCILCWLERWIGLGLAEVIDKYFPFIRLITYFSFVIVFIIIYRNNTDFQACFRQVWKCSNNRYIDEISDIHSPNKDTDSVNQTSQVYFHQNGTDGC
ncbi:hypothetical protein ILUMI_09063 [Ignelater luminosus]|uniref:G-protein coupled receptors family 1 profile domain-containing protein n=1 Tax=Ignelater luminosus TaxID=2038154 RepID=A0A8K0D6H2_IGNLU|nr:hypothetical protein ILUMI_09063 [Ignelater luminosus]